jgi:hypothetical protein
MTRARAAAARLFSIDVRSLAALRITLGAILLVDIIARAPYLDVNYTDQGVLPREALDGAWSLHALGGGVVFEGVLFVVAGALAAMVLIGYRTALATAGSWLLLISLHGRSWPMTDGGDILLGTLVLWSAFLPLGACWSVDAMRARRGGGADTVVCSAATVALMLQILFLYELAGILKYGPDWRSTGTAIERALEQTYWRLPPGGFLTQFPGLLRMMSLGVPWFEIVGPLALFVPVWTARLRMVTIAAFAIFQLGLGLCIQLGLFPWVSTAATLAFIPTEVWDRLFRRWRPSGATVSRPGWVREGAVAILLIYCVAAGVSALGLFELPARLRRVANRLGIVEGWAMYAPQSARWDIRFEIVTQRPDGTAVDLLADGPERLRRLHRTRRFKYFLETMLRGSDQVRLRRYYLRWVCRAWSPDGYAYLFVALRTLPDGAWERTLLLYDDCRAAARS